MPNLATSLQARSRDSLIDQAMASKSYCDDSNHKQKCLLVKGRSSQTHCFDDNISILSLLYCLYYLTCQGSYGSVVTTCRLKCVKGECHLQVGHDHRGVPHQRFIW